MMTAPARALTMFAKALSNSSGPRTWTICSGTFGPGGHFRFSDELRGRSVITVCEDSHAGGSRDDHPEEFQPLPGKLRGHHRQPRRVPARPHEACHEPLPTGSAITVMTTGIVWLRRRTARIASVSPEMMMSTGSST